ncbi:unnamed protein product [Boreogadus saida]
MVTMDTDANCVQVLRLRTITLCTGDLGWKAVKTRTLCFSEACAEKIQLPCPPRRLCPIYPISRLELEEDH